MAKKALMRGKWRMSPPHHLKSKLSTACFTPSDAQNPRIRDYGHGRAHCFREDESMLFSGGGYDDRYGPNYVGGGMGGGGGGWHHHQPAADRYGNSVPYQDRQGEGAFSGGYPRYSPHGETAAYAHHQRSADNPSGYGGFGSFDSGPSTSRGHFNQPRVALVVPQASQPSADTALDSAVKRRHAAAVMTKAVKDRLVQLVKDVEDALGFVSKMVDSGENQLKVN